MDRAQIEALKIGDELERTLDTVPWTDMTQVKPDARWGFRGKIVRIAFRGISVQGKAYVGGDTEFGGNGGTMSFSLSEGEAHVRLVPSEIAQ